MNNRLIGPQEKQRNLREIKTQRISSMRFYLLLKFHRNFIGFHRVHFFHSKGFVEKIPIEIKYSKISMNSL